MRTADADKSPQNSNVILFPKQTRNQSRQNPKLPKVLIVQMTERPFAPSQPIIIDGTSKSDPVATGYLAELRRNGRSHATVLVKARQLCDFLGILAASDDGKGIPIAKIDDLIIEKWCYHLTSPKHDAHGRLTGNRGIKPETFNSYLATVLHFLQFAQRCGFVTNLIGPHKSRGINYPVKIITENDRTRHQSLQRSKGITKPSIPTALDLEFVEATLIGRSNRIEIQRREEIIAALSLAGALRRSETCRLKIDQFPTRKDIVHLRATHRGEGSPSSVQIKVVASKNGGIRTISLPFWLVEKTRMYIDYHRHKLHPKNNNVRELFISTKTGLGLTPQAITNSFKKAAQAAHADSPNPFGQFDLRKARPHHRRHRGITNFALQRIRPGIDTNTVIMSILEFTGLRSVETASHYMHLANHEFPAPKPVSSNEQPVTKSSVKTRETGSLLPTLVRAHKAKRK